MNPLENLLAAVGAAPALPGARCRGRHELYDATIAVSRGDPDVARAARDDARATAMRLCHSCSCSHSVLAVVRQPAEGQAARRRDRRATQHQTRWQTGQHNQEGNHMTDTPDDARVNLSEAAALTCRHAELIVVPLDPTTLGLALVLDTHEFGRIAVSLSIKQVASLAQQCARATQVTPEQMAALMRLATNNEGDQTS